MNNITYNKTKAYEGFELHIISNTPIKFELDLIAKEIRNDNYKTIMETDKNKFRINVKGYEDYGLYLTKGDK